MALSILIAVIALAHLWFLVLEMFLWSKPFGRKTFGMSVEQAAATAVLAGNQGLYNGFLAAGLFWSLSVPGVATKTFFLACVAVAGLYGVYSTKKVAILILQTVPAAIALAWLWLAPS
jgi:putative membrane protein